MKKAFFLAFVAALTVSQVCIAAPSIPQGKYEIDPNHSSVAFEIPYLVISTVDGRFNNFTASFEVDKKNQISAKCDIDVASVDTGIQKRDEHLRSPDFFDVTKFPKMTYVTKKVVWKDATNFTVVGDLTMHGVTKEVLLTAKYLGSVKDMQSKQRAAITATGTLNRRDFGLVQNMMVESGQVIGDQVTLIFKLQAVKL